MDPRKKRFVPVKSRQVLDTGKPSGTASPLKPKPTIKKQWDASKLKVSRADIGQVVQTVGRMQVDPSVKVIERG